MPTTLVTGATGFVGSHVARALVARGDDVRVTVRATSNLDALAGLDVETTIADLTDRRAVRRALQGVARVFHVAGSTNLRAQAEALFEANVVATRVVLEECLRAEVERVVHTSSTAAIGPAPKGGTADERQLWRGGLGIPYADAKHEAEVEALRIAARGLPVVVVCPAYVLGRGDLGRSSTELVRRFMLRRIPAYVEGAINVVDVEDVAAGMLLADARGRPRRALHPRQPQLHVGPPVRRPRAAVGGRAAGAAALEDGGAGAGRDAGARARPDPDHAGRGAQRRAAGGPTARPRRGASWAGRRARTRRPSRRPSPGTASARAGGWRGSGRGSRSAGGRPASRCGGSASWCRERAAAPLPHADELALPVRPGGARAGRARTSSSRRSGSPGGRATATRSTTSPGSARCRCSSSAAR